MDISARMERLSVSGTRTVQARSAVSGPFEFETILKVLVEFYKDGGLRRRIEVPRQNDGQFPSLDSHFPESVEQVLDLFAVDKPEGMEVFPTGGGVQVKTVFKGIQAEIDQPYRQG